MGGFSVLIIYSEIKSRWLYFFLKLANVEIKFFDLSDMSLIMNLGKICDFESPHVASHPSSVF